MTAVDAASTVHVHGDRTPEFDAVLSRDALAFVADLEARFGPRRRELLAARAERQQRFDAGEAPDFDPGTAAIRDGDWSVRPAPADLQDRRVEITGPVDRKMVINALNSGAKCFMADFEDATSPTWANLIGGQINLRDAVARTIAHVDPATGKRYGLGDDLATLIVRPRGWHLEDAHLSLDGRRLSAGLVDFGLYVFHNHAALRGLGSGPYFYLPKLEHADEARLWADVFAFAEARLGLSRGTVRATVLIETLPAAFQLHEILHALKDWAVGLNCGRWDYIFSYIKRLRARPDRVLPDRAAVTMTAPFMRAYARLVIETCHRRGAHAMGGMSAFIPVKDDAAANAAAIEQVRADKSREVQDGHDGTWVAHPGLVAVAKEVFDEHMPAANQLSRTAGYTATAAELTAPAPGAITEAGVRGNVGVAVLYVASWLRGQGAAPIHNLMEDAATAEIARAQLWQWRTHGARLDDGRAVDAALLDDIFDDELARLRRDLGAEFDTGRTAEAAGVVRDLVFRSDFVEFLTLPAYERLIEPRRPV